MHTISLWYQFCTFRMYFIPEKVQEFFAQDVDPAEANILAVGTAIIQSIIAEKSGPPAWKQLPTWY